MTTNDAPRPLTHAERLALYSAATPTITMPTGPIRKLPPRRRRNSVKHRAIR